MRIVEKSNGELLDLLYQQENFKLVQIERMCHIPEGTLRTARSKGKGVPTKYRVVIIEFIQKNITGEEL